VLTLVVVEVDQVAGDADAAKGGFDDVIGPADEGDDGAVVVGVGADVEHLDAGHFADGVGDAAVNRGVAAVAEVGDTLYERLHTVSSEEIHGLKRYLPQIWQIEQIIKTRNLFSGNLPNLLNLRIIPLRFVTGMAQTG
jgi:hypothetical protein